MTRVFISYSHDSEAHKRRVGGLAKRLRQEGFDVHLDQDLPSPREGWPTWCWHQIEAADYVLMVCTEMYHQRVMHQTTGEVGTGVMWEARLIWQLLYNSRSATGKFVPVLFSGHSLQDIPLPVQGATSYNVDAKADYATLRNLLTVRRAVSSTARPRPSSPAFGRDEIAKEIVAELQQRRPVILRGFGGIGKSTVAQLVWQQCEAEGLFDVITWVDLRQYRSSASDNALLYQVFDNIARESDPKSLPPSLMGVDQRIQSVITMLCDSERKHLLIFDNYESILQSGVASFATVAAKLASFIKSLTAQVAVLITTREEPDLELRVVRTLQKLDDNASRQLVRQKAKDLQITLSEEKATQVLALTHGIPKIIEVTIGLLRYRDLASVESVLKTPRVPLGDEIYDYLFREAWQVLGLLEKHLLWAMTFFTRWAPPEALQETAGLAADAFWKVVERLSGMSLLDVLDATPDAKRYSIHPLTYHLCQVELERDSGFDDSASMRFVEFYLRYCKDNYETNTGRLQFEMDNVLAAMRTANNHGLFDLLIEFRTPVNRFLWKAGYWLQRVEANTLILSACEKLGKEVMAARVLVEDLGFTYLRFEDLDKAEAYVRKGLALFHKHDVKDAEALAIRHLGKAALLRGEYEWVRPGRGWEDYFRDGETLYSESLDIRKSLQAHGPDQIVAIGDLKLDFGRLYWLWGRKRWIEARRRGDPILEKQSAEMFLKAIDVSEEAKSLFERCESVEDLEDQQRGISKAWGNIGNVQKQRAWFYREVQRRADAVLEMQKAELTYEESLEIASRIDKADEVAHACWGLGEVYEFFADQFPVTCNEYLEKALELATRSHELYARMATPHDEKVTKGLQERVAKKLRECVPSEAQKGGAFYPDRNYIPPFPELLQKSRQEVAIVGVALLTVPASHSELIEGLLAKGLQVKLLFMSPAKKGGGRVPYIGAVEEATRIHSLSNLLKAQIKYFQRWRMFLDHQRREHLDIRLYPHLPTATMVLIDKESEDGLIKLEHLLFEFPPLSRPSNLVTKKGSPDLFKRLESMFNRLWETGFKIDDPMWDGFLGEPE